MCLYQTDLQWQRRRATRERTRDIVSSDLDTLVETYRPAKPATRPVMQRVLGVMCRTSGRIRGLFGRLKTGRPSADTRLHPHTQ